MNPSADLTSPPEEGRLARSVVAGIVAALLVVMGGVFFDAALPRRWSATAALVVLPAPNLNQEAVAGFYETLSRGQIVATYAEILRSQRFEVAAERELRLTPAQRREASVSVRIVPETALITVTATAASPTVAERLADRIAAVADTSISALGQPYTVSSVTGARGTAEKSGISTEGLALVVGVVALAVGLAAQQAVYQLLGLAARRRRVVGSGRPYWRPEPEEESRQQPQLREVVPPPAPAASRSGREAAFVPPEPEPSRGWTEPEPSLSRGDEEARAPWSPPPARSAWPEPQPVAAPQDPGPAWPESPGGAWPEPEPERPQAGAWPEPEPERPQAGAWPEPEPRPFSAQRLGRPWPEPAWPEPGTGWSEPGTGWPEPGPAWPEPEVAEPGPSGQEGDGQGAGESERDAFPPPPPPPTTAYP